MTDLDRALQRLLAGTDPMRVVRKVEPAPGRVYYKIPSERATEELAAAIEHVRDDRLEKVAGVTAGMFLSNVVGLLFDEGRLLVDQLPVHIGRVRYLVAQTPKHANGRPFDSPVLIETEGVYIETALLTRADARSHAARLCRSVGVEVLDSDADTEVGA